MADPFDDFDLGQAGSPQGLDVLDPFGGATPPQPQAPAAPVGSPMNRNAVLAAILPIIAAKGGRPAIGAFLQGLQAADQRKAAEARQAQLDAQARGQQQATQDYRTQGLGLQRQRLQATVDAQKAKDAATASATANDRGMRQMAVDAIGAGTAPQAAAGQYFAETGKALPSEVLPAKASTAAPGSFEDYVAKRYAPARGKTPEQLTDVDIEDARKRFQQSDDRPRITVNTPGAGGLPPRTQSAVDALARSFDAHPTVRNTQVMGEAVSFAQGLDDHTKNPADDQALIYAFAKAMDPNSVVREGEYATVQKYAQSWAESFGFNAARIFSNAAFLTPEARANMKATILSRFQAARGQYDNLRNEFGRRINQKTGAADGVDRLTDYGGAFPGQPTQPSAPTVPANPLGNYQDYLKSRRGAK